MKFEKDIFISYAHIDDESLIENQRGWITEFNRSLEIRLAQLLGRRPVIWRDPSLQGNHVFDQQIVDQFRNVAIMISVLTPRYIKSEWCQREVNEFYEACSQNLGFTVDNKCRVFKVIKTPVRVEMHPDKIRNVLGYEFYSTDPHTARVKEFSALFGQQYELAYWEKLDDLANDICSFLEQLEAIGTTTNTPAGPVKAAPVALYNNTAPNLHLPDKKQKKVYLAESSYDTQEFRNSIKRELQDNNCYVLPDKQLPLIAPVLQLEIEQFIGQADMCVHLVGAGYGVVPEGAQTSIVEIQNSVAGNLAAHHVLPRLVWVPENTIATDERQQQFLQKLKTNSGSGEKKLDLVYGSLEEFKGILMDGLKALEAPPPPQISASPEGHASHTPVSNKLVYIICDLQDSEEVRTLEDALFAIGCEVIIPIFEGEESEIREDHIENLKMCDVAMVYFGNAGELWLRSKMRDFLKMGAYGRIRPLDMKAVYLAPPVNPGKSRFRSLDTEIIDGTAGIPRDRLKQLFAQL